MSSYRFCRTDDIALLVEAWNRCGLPHEPGASPMTVDGFKKDIRDLGVWCSSCMVAVEGGLPVGVLIGCKRPPHTLVHRIAVHPAHLRRGHGRHLLTSLSAKLAILGPKTLLAEIAADNPAAKSLFASCGWRIDRHFVDLSVERAPVTAATLAVHDVLPEELDDGGLPPAESIRSWERSRPTIAARAVRMRGLAVASTDRIDASLFYAPEENGAAKVWSVSYERDDAGEAALAALLREVVRREHSAVVLPRVGPDEIDSNRLHALGLNYGPMTTGYISEATAA